MDRLRWGGFVLRRLVWAIPTLFGISIITFAMIHLAPGDPVQAQGGAVGRSASLQELTSTRRLFFLDLPLFFNLSPRGLEGRVVRESTDYLARGRMDGLRRCGTVCLPELARRAAADPRLVPVLDRIRLDHPRLGPSTARGMAWASAVLPLIRPEALERTAADMGRDPRAIQRLTELGSAALPVAMDALLSRHGDAHGCREPLRSAEWSTPVGARIAASAVVRALTGIDGRLRATDSAVRRRRALEGWQEWWFQHERDHVRFSWWRRIHGRITETQFAKWLGRVVTLQFGYSTRDGMPVTEKLGEALPVTLLLSLLSMALAYLLGVPLGIHSAVHDGRWSERAVTVVLFVLYSLPAFWVAMMLILLFGGVGHWDWFPIHGLSSEGLEDAGGWVWFVDRLHHLVLPVACLTYGSLAVVSRYQRTAMLEVIRQDFIRTARAKGLSDRAVIFRHALPNAVLPVITLMGLQFPYLISGSVIVERIFNIPGMGMLTFDAFLNRDYPVIMAVSVISAAMTLLGLILADLCYAIVDPRIRPGAIR